MGRPAGAREQQPQRGKTSDRSHEAFEDGATALPDAFGADMLAPGAQSDAEPHGENAGRGGTTARQRPWHNRMAFAEPVALSLQANRSGMAGHALGPIATPPRESDNRGNAEWRSRQGPPLRLSSFERAPFGQGVSLRQEIEPTRIPQTDREIWRARPTCLPTASRR